MPGTIYHNNSRTVHSLCFIHVLYSLTHKAYPPYTWDRHDGLCGKREAIFLAQTK